jgi:chromosome partitioning protein
MESLPMARFTVFNQKGGVGKTTTALNLTAAFGLAGLNPLAIDLDPQAHLTSLCGVATIGAEQSLYAHYRDGKPLGNIIQDTGRGWSLLPAHLELAKIDTQFGKGLNILHKLALSLDRERLGEQRAIILDCSPQVSVLSLSAIFAADLVLVPVSADYLAVKGAVQVEKTLNALGPVLKKRIARRYVITRFDARRKMSWKIDRTFREKFGADVCETRIAESVSVAESPFGEMDVFAHAPGSRGATDYQALYDELALVGWGRQSAESMKAATSLPAMAAALSEVPRSVSVFS